MRINRLISSLFCITLAGLQSMAAYAQGDQRADPPGDKWIAYYADTHQPVDFKPYDILVFDRERHPSLQNLKAQRKTILGYMSVGEAEKDRYDYEQVKATNSLLKENPNWPGVFSVDVRKAEWTRHLIEDVIPKIIQSGFDGVFIDTLDSVEQLETENPKKYQGMVDASVRMIKTIRMHYPELKIMINRGFKTMPHIADSVDYLLAESILVNYDFENGDHKLFSDDVYQNYIAQIEEIKKHAPHLYIMTLDYWNMDDTETVKTIYERQRQQGFAPYVSTIELNNIFEEPQ